MTFNEKKFNKAQKLIYGVFIIQILLILLLLVNTYIPFVTITGIMFGLLVVQIILSGMYLWLFLTRNK